MYQRRQQPSHHHHITRASRGRGRSTSGAVSHGDSEVPHLPGFRSAPEGADNYGTSGDSEVAVRNDHGPSSHSRRLSEEAVLSKHAVAGLRGSGRVLRRGRQRFKARRGGLGETFPSPTPCVGGVRWVEKPPSAFGPSQGAHTCNTDRPAGVHTNRSSADGRSSLRGGLGGTARSLNIGLQQTGPTDLPIHKHRDEIVEHIRAQQVTCIQGETGCGKSTMVPQFIIEDALRRGEYVNVVVTQPRRIACVALATRVASSLGQEVGETVGFRVSGRVVTSARTVLTFLTTGYLLQMLISYPTALARYSHVVLDEVHERNVEADLLSLVVKLQSEALGAVPAPKIVVMSATLQGDLFSRYFCSSHDLSSRICVGVQRFPVDSYYLEDLIIKSGVDHWRHYVASEDTASGSSSALQDPSRRMPRINQPPLLDFDPFRDASEDRHEDKKQVLSSLTTQLLARNNLGTFTLSPRNEAVVRNCCKAFAGRSPGASGFRHGGVNTLARLPNATIMEGLMGVVVELVRKFGVSGESVLIFLPGLGEITDLHEHLSVLENESGNSIAGNPLQRLPLSITPSAPEAAQAPGIGTPNTGSAHKKYKVFVLHSVIPYEEQEMVFQRPAQDTVHIILASNIAESSLTLPNVRIVIDFCLRNQVQYDPRKHLSSLVKVWTSKASSRQRLGRAGRVFAGVCIRLVSRSFFETAMTDFDTPDILSAPLEKLYLQTKQLGYRLLAARERAGLHRQQRIPHERPYSNQLTAKGLLKLSIEPPPMESVDRAVLNLHEMGALTDTTEEARVTCLGRLAVQMPLDVKLSRLLLYSIALGVPVDGIILAVCVSSDDPFTLPSHLTSPDTLTFSRSLKRSFQWRSYFDNGAYSEPLMLRNLMCAWLYSLEASIRPDQEWQSFTSHLTGMTRAFCQKFSLAAKRFVPITKSLVEVAVRLRKAIHPDLANDPSISKIDCLINLLTRQTGRRSASLVNILETDGLFLKCLLAMTFSPHFAVGTPALYIPPTATASDCGETTSKFYRGVVVKGLNRRVDALRAVHRIGFDPSRCILIPMLSVPIDVLRMSLEKIYDGGTFEVKECATGNKLTGLIYFAPDARTEVLPNTATAEKWHPSILLDGSHLKVTSIPMMAHMLRQFGGGRWKFQIPSPDEQQMEMLKRSGGAHWRLTARKGGERTFLASPNALTGAQPSSLSAKSASSLFATRIQADDSADADEEEPTDQDLGSQSHCLPMGSSEEGEESTMASTGRKNDFLAPVVEICQPVNPCLVKWRILNFWSESDYQAATRHSAPEGGSPERPFDVEFSASTTKEEADGKCYYRNPVGFLASFPWGFRHQMDRNQSPQDSEAAILKRTEESEHHLMFAAFVNQQGTERSQSTRLEGVTVLPALLGALLMLGTLRDTLDLRFLIHANALSGLQSPPRIVVRGTRQELPLRLRLRPLGFSNYSRFDRGDGAEGAAAELLEAISTQNLTIGDLAAVNHFRAALSSYFHDLEVAAAADDLGPCDIEDVHYRSRYHYTGSLFDPNNSDICIWKGVSVSLVKAVENLIRHGNCLRNGEASESNSATLSLFRGSGRDMGEFFRGISVLREKENTGGRSRGVLARLRNVSAKKLNSVHCVSAFETAERQTGEHKPFLCPITLCNIAEAIDRSRAQWILKLGGQPPSRAERHRAAGAISNYTPDKAEGALMSRHRGRGRGGGAMQKSAAKSSLTMVTHHDTDECVQRDSLEVEEIDLDSMCFDLTEQSRPDTSFAGDVWRDHNAPTYAEPGRLWPPQNFRSSEHGEAVFDPKQPHLG